MSTPIQSLTAVKHGWGRDSYRWVSGLTKCERQAVKDGVLVWFAIKPWHYMQSGYKVVTYKRGRYDAREPNDREISQIGI